MELYDLKADPQEMNNLAERKPDVAEKFKALLERKLASQAKFEITPRGLMDKETVEMLEALGYM